MSVKQAVANALSFASLAGLGRAKGARAESDEEKDKEKKDDDAKAESEEEDAKAEDDKPEDKDDEKKESKAEGKEDDETDDEKKEKAAATLKPIAGTPAERQRCKAIVAHGVKMSVAAGGDLAPVIDACMLAFDTDVSAEAAIGSMSARADVAAALPRKATGQALDARMGAEVVPIAKPEAGRVDANDPKAIALTVIAAAKKARGEA